MFRQQFPTRQVPLLAARRRLSLDSGIPLRQRMPCQGYRRVDRVFRLSRDNRLQDNKFQDKQLQFMPSLSRCQGGQQPRSIPVSRANV